MLIDSLQQRPRIQFFPNPFAVISRLMNIVGDDYFRRSFSQEGYFIKLVLNSRAAHFIPSSTEHRDASLPGMSYRDDSMGDALAATVKATQIDIRLHKAFSPSQVKAVLERLEQSIGDYVNSQPFKVHYGGEYLTTIRLNTSCCVDGPRCSDALSNENARLDSIERGG